MTQRYFHQAIMRPRLFLGVELKPAAFNGFFWVLMYAFGSTPLFLGAAFGCGAFVHLMLRALNSRDPFFFANLARAQRWKQGYYPAHARVHAQIEEPEPEPTKLYNPATF